MDLRQLRYLVALAEERNFTRAAAREHIAQPALSQQIRRLEQETGLALVERTTRRLTLTEAGAMLVARARRILAELEAAEDELSGLRGVPSAGAAHRRRASRRLRAAGEARIQPEQSHRPSGCPRPRGGHPATLRHRHRHRRRRG